jgi:hypothetical protein
MELLKSTLLSRHSKVKLYKTLIRPAVTYGAETWTMSAADENVCLSLSGRLYGGYTAL